MNLFRFSRRCGLLCFGLFAASCGSTQTGVNSLDQLTTSTSNHGVLSKPINFKYPLQTRFLAVNGLLPVSGPGSACLADSYRPSSAIICYSDSGRTEVAYREYKTSATLADLKSIRDGLNALQVELVNLLQAEVAAAGDPALNAQTQVARANSAQAITNAAKAIEDKAQKENVFLFRWRGDQAAGGEGGFGGFFSGKASAEASQSGVVIVGGLVLSQLLIGKNDYQSVFSGYSRSTKIATLSMGAQKHLMYFADASLNAAIAAELDGTLDDLSSKLSPATEVALKAYAAIGLAQENQGNFSAVPLRTMPLQQYQASRPTEQVFYSTLTDVETLLDALND